MFKRARVLLDDSGGGGGGGMPLKILTFLLTKKKTYKNRIKSCVY